MSQLRPFLGVAENTPRGAIVNWLRTRAETVMLARGFAQATGAERRVHTEFAAQREEQPHRHGRHYCLRNSRELWQPHRHGRHYCLILHLERFDGGAAEADDELGRSRRSTTSRSSTADASESDSADDGPLNSGSNALASFASRPNSRHPCLP